MAELQIDDDWKRQAQEEKRRLAEQQKRAEPAPAPAARETPARSDRRELPAGFDGLLSLLLTQALYYLGEMSEESDGPLDLDMARHQIDLLGTLEEKTRGNLTPQEQQALDAALYEVRMRYVSIATQMIR